MKKIFLGHGGFGSRRVHIYDGQKMTELPLRLDLRNHSPCGFEWGYGGSGPAQLALALLVAACEDGREAGECYQQFKEDVVCRIPQQMGWILSDEAILRWLSAARHGGRVKLRVSSSPLSSIAAIETEG